MPPTLDIRDLEVVGVKVQSADRSWKPMDYEQLEEIVADAIAVLIQNNEDTDDESDEESLLSITDESDDAESFAQPKVGQATDDNSSDSADSREVKSVPVKNDLQSAVANIYGKMVDLVAKKELTHLSRSPSEIFGSNWIYFIDSGGAASLPQSLASFCAWH